MRARMSPSSAAAAAVAAPCWLGASGALPCGRAQALVLCWDAADMSAADMSAAGPRPRPAHTNRAYEPRFGTEDNPIQVPAVLCEF
jgi:hypothetical protein